MIVAGAGGSGELGGAPRARRGRLSWPSVTQMLPSLSTVNPCGNTIVPEPQLLPTQSDLPSRSTPTPLVDPHFRPSGILRKFSMVRYGLGRSFVGCGVC